jgi:hypothetical protein
LQCQSNQKNQKFSVLILCQHQEKTQTNKNRMKMKQIVAMASACLLAGASSAWAGGPALAEDDAYKMAVYQTAHGFTIYPASSGMAKAGDVVTFLLPVTKGIRYQFLLGIDEYIGDADIYVLDENMGEVVTDRRGLRRAAVGFTAAYSGTVDVKLHFPRVNGMGGWAMLVGTRGGAQRIDPIDPSKKPLPTSEPARDRSSSVETP